jgi:hypothetical protein
MTEDKQIKDNDIVFTTDMDQLPKMHRDNKQKYQCELCRSTFSTSTRLLGHLESVHLNLRKWKCEKCDYSANLKHFLTVHVKAIHDKIKDHKCKQDPRSQVSSL